MSRYRSEREEKLLEDVISILRPQQIEFVGVRVIPANSGGVILSSGEVVAVSLKALGRNSGDIYLGGPNNPPYSGHGYCLERGEAINIDVKQLENIRVVAEISGDRVTWASVK